MPTSPASRQAKRRAAQPRRVSSLAAIFPMGRIFQGPRVFLRRLDRGQAEAYRRLLERNRFWLQPWMPEVPHPLTVADLRKIIAGEHQELKRAQRVDLGLFRTQDRQLIGKVALHSIQWGVSFSAGLGYWIDADLAGAGLMTEAVARVVAVAFEEMGLHRLWAGVQPTNHPSQRVLEKLGFVREGLHRQELFINGRWQDQYFYTLLETEFHAKRAQWVVEGWLGD